MLVKTEPKISVIIPVYNVEKYLKKCLDSLVNQTFKDIEIICINDGSTDDCLSILNEYAAKDERIIVISQENQGPGAARNKGLEIAKGEYISFIDPDDWVNTEFYSELYNEAKISDYDIVKGVRINVNSKNVIKKHKQLEPGMFFYSWLSCIYKTKIINDNKLRFPAAYSFEDMAFLMLFFSFAKKYSASEKASYYCFQRMDSLTPQGKSLLRSIEGFDAKMYAFRLIQQYDIPKTDYLNIMKHFIGSFLYSITLFINNGHYEKFESISPYINEVLNCLKYKDDLLTDDNFKFLTKGDFSKKSFDNRYIKTKFNNFGLLKKIFYIGNARDYKMISILGILFTFKRFRT